jgi:hypothetical protein
MEEACSKHTEFGWSIPDVGCRAFLLDNQVCLYQDCYAALLRVMKLAVKCSNLITGVLNYFYRP